MTNKFKDTKLGALLKEKAPNILKVAGDLLPDKGILGIVKNLIDTSDDISPADKAMLHAHLKEMYDIEVRDRESARTREVEVAKTGRFDLLFNLTGLVGLGTFVFMVYAIVYLTIPTGNKDVWIQLIGICQGVALSIFGYFFGSSIKKNIQ